MASVIVLDTETTGMDPDDEIIEIATVCNGDVCHSLVQSSKVIKYAAMATHHITGDMLDGAPDYDTVMGVFLPEGDNVYCAHNAQFDKQFLPAHVQSAQWICTYRCSLVLYPDAEKHSNQSLRYELGLDVADMPEEAGNLPHRALYDAWVTSKLLDKMLETHSVDDLVRITANPILLHKVSFGKHMGEEWSSVPRGYLRWVLGQDFDSDTIYTAKHHLHRGIR